MTKNQRQPQETNVVPVHRVKATEQSQNKHALEGSSGFPPLFQELSKKEQQMAIQYISHADDTERLVRIQRIQHSIESSKENSTIKHSLITGDVDKGNGHIFGFVEESTRLHRKSLNGENH